MAAAAAATANALLMFSSTSELGCHSTVERATNGRKDNRAAWAASSFYLPRPAVALSRLRLSLSCVGLLTMGNGTSAGRRLKVSAGPLNTLRAL